MKEYKVRVADKARVVKDLNHAKLIAKNASIVNFRASVFCDSKKIAHYEWAKKYKKNKNFFKKVLKNA